MARTKICIYEYTPSGKFKLKHNSIREAIKYHYPTNPPTNIYKRRILDNMVYLFPNGNYGFLHRIGRKLVTHVDRVYNSEYCSNYITKTIKKIGVYNLEGFLLLEARNINVLSKITGISKATIINSLKSSLDAKSIPTNEFIFKYID